MTDDLISRQAAIDALNEYFARIGKLKRRGLTKGEKAISLDTVGAIKTLPSAEPKIIRCKDYDLISRQAAIDVIEAGRLTKLIDAETAVNGLKALPSAQQWIPRSKRLPKVREWVLCQC